MNLCQTNEKTPPPLPLGDSGDQGRPKRKRKPLVKTDFSEAVLKRFWGKVEKKGPDDCWEWRAYRSPKGYGQFAVNRTCIAFSHRVSFAIENGTTPTDLIVCHRCDNPPCCNPGHLFLGTEQENSSDMVRKLRSSRGEARSDKLTESAVIEIKTAYASGNYSYKTLGAAYNVEWSTIRAIIKGRNWKHINITT